MLKKHHDVTSSILNDYEMTKDWLLRHIGINPNQGRFRQYQNILSDVLENGHPINPDDVRLYYQSVLETNRINLIRKSFFDSYSPGLKDRVKKIMKGVSWRHIANKPNSKGVLDDPARNFMFEMTWASKFAREGLNVNLDHNGDVFVVYDGFNVLIECKRLLSAKQLNKNLKKAWQQIVVARKVNRKVAGIIAIDITDVLYPDAHILMNATHAESINICRRDILMFLSEHKQIIDKHFKSEISQIIFYSDIVTHCEERDLFLVGSYCTPIENPKGRAELKPASDAVIKTLSAGNLLKLNRSIGSLGWHEPEY